MLRYVSPANGLTSLLTQRQIIHHLWSEYPAASLPNTVAILPEIFSRLVSFDVATRAEGATALSGFAYALLSVWSSIRSNFKAVVLRELLKFLFSEGAVGARLPQGIARAVREDTAGAPHKGPRWAVKVICCFIILSGHGVLASHRLCGFVIKTAELVTNCRKKPGPELLVCIWRSLIWAFAQFPRDDIPPKTNSKEQSEGPRDDSRKSALDIVKQEPRGGNAVCLIACLLYEQPSRSGQPLPPELDKAISVLKDVVSSPSDSVYRSGVSILERLVGAIGVAESVPGDVSTATWTPDDVPINAMFSRRMLDAELSAFSSAIQDAGRVSLSAIRPLLEQEVQQHWKELLEIWTICAHRELRRTEHAALPVCFHLLLVPPPCYSSGMRLGCPDACMASSAPGEDTPDARARSPYRLPGVHGLRCNCPLRYSAPFYRWDNPVCRSRRRPTSRPFSLPSALGRRQESLFGRLALNRGRLPSQQRRPTYVRPLNGRGENGVERSVRISHLDKLPGLRRTVGSGG